jgi:hypothetical protein
MEHQKTFGPYSVLLDTDIGDGVTGCWISRKVDGKTYSASLAAASFEGVLIAESYSSGGEYSRPIPESVVNAIEEWAESMGY